MSGIGVVIIVAGVVLFFRRLLAEIDAACEAEKRRRSDESAVRGK